MPLILPGNVGSATASTGFNVDNSCRFGVNTYMHKAFSSDNEKDTWTFSLWVKRGNSGSTQRMMTHNGATSGKFFYLRWESNEQLHFHIGMSDGNFAGFDTTQVFRDHSAWSHIVCAVDTTQGTEANRVKIYVNGSQVTAFGTANYPAQNTTASIGRTDTPMVVGALYGSGYGITSGSPQEFYDGYLAEVCFIDDAQLAADQFGEFDEDSAIWKPKDVSGLTFGTDGFYLDFEDSSNLGNDANGGTDLTEVNLAATDQSTDTCTNNFATLNPLDVFDDDGRTLSEGNLNFTTSSGNNGNISGTLAVSGSGKWYFETKISAQSGSASSSAKFGIVGVRDLDKSTPSSAGNAYYIYSDGRKEDGANTTNSAHPGYSTNDIVQVALDLDNGNIYFGLNGDWGDNDGNFDEAFADATAFFGSINTNGFWTIYLNKNVTADNVLTLSANFGSPSFAISSGNTDGNGYGNFEYAVPSGYYSLNTKNLAEYG